ncbi:hypothetical protein DLAC_00823 [Tieghemostelium lacteum]|uniref:CCHC-type domain-containing protein n=1 Tax=Tieghemostelium lacteum TaxID=361077 RepID=A0A152A713_TIELA|nr:hypothetical protein DLAC_00823 [Tieghemostelium lacteum]|eukprot:KYR02028.1 hypothetical protein DLAC_00823 [Tieghemostelium lacteum]
MDNMSSTSTLKSEIITTPLKILKPIYKNQILNVGSRSLQKEIENEYNAKVLGLSISSSISNGSVTISGKEISNNTEKTPSKDEIFAQFQGYDEKMEEEERDNDILLLKATLGELDNEEVLEKYINTPTKSTETILKENTIVSSKNDDFVKPSDRQSSFSKRLRISVEKRYFVSEVIRCERCGDRDDHFTFECPLMLNNYQEKPCYRCGENGHFIGTCTTYLCYKCGLFGHFPRFCNDNNLQYLKRSEYKGLGTLVETENDECERRQSRVNFTKNKSQKEKGMARKKQWRDRERDFDNQNYDRDKPYDRDYSRYQTGKKPHEHNYNNNNYNNRYNRDKVPKKKDHIKKKHDKKELKHKKEHNGNRKSNDSNNYKSRDGYKNYDKYQSKNEKYNNNNNNSYKKNNNNKNNNSKKRERDFDNEDDYNNNNYNYKNNYYDKKIKK